MNRSLLPLRNNVYIQPFVTNGNFVQKNGKHLSRKIPQLVFPEHKNQSKVTFPYLYSRLSTVDPKKLTFSSKFFVLSCKQKTAEPLEKKANTLYLCEQNLYYKSQDIFLTVKLGCTTQSFPVKPRSTEPPIESLSFLPSIPKAIPIFPFFISLEAEHRQH